MESRPGLDIDGNQKIEIINSENNNGQPEAISPPLSPQTPRSSTQSHDVLLHHSPAMLAKEFRRASDLLMSFSVCAEENKSKVKNFVAAAAEELTQLAVEQQPLWLRNGDIASWILNEVEYKRRFGPLDATLEEVIRLLKTGEPIKVPGFNGTTAEVPREEHDEVFNPKLPMEFTRLTPLQTEASRETGFLPMSPFDLVKMLMDVDEWSAMFSSIVSKATILGTLSSTGEAENLDGALQVMTVEFHIPTPLVKTRESCFARYSRQLAPSTWLVVDVSLESLFGKPLIRYERRPSGCLIQGMQNEYSKVIWVENLQVDNSSVHALFQPIVSSGFAFSAKRWLATLARGCDRLTTLMDAKSSAVNDGRKSLEKLADRMMRGYYASVSTSHENPWRPLPVAGAEDIMVMATANVDDPGVPSGVSITIATSVSLPFPPMDVYNFLRDANARNQWDLLSHGHVTREALCLPTSQRCRENCISLVAVDTATPNRNMTLYLQECFADSTASYVVYAPLDVQATSMLLRGCNPDLVQILASGFAILPDRPAAKEEQIQGTLLTVSFRILDKDLSTPHHLPPKSLSISYKIISETISMITEALVSRCMESNSSAKGN